MAIRRKIGLIGCGSIGSEIARAVSSGKVRGARIVSLFDLVEKNALSLNAKLHPRAKVYDNIDDFISSGIDLAIEAASQVAVRQFAEKLLAARLDVMLMSAGALADGQFLSKLLEIAARGEVRIYLPSGAVAGLDAIRSVRDELTSVTLTTTKNPKALEGAPYFLTSKIKLSRIRRKTLIYEGSAADAVTAFPANVNVAAVLSLAGIGVEKTLVRIVADPSIAINQHEIDARGGFGEFRIVLRNKPSPTNPKTSYLAILSAIECLRAICNPGMSIGS